jgi:hypothetical protein
MYEHEIIRLYFSHEHEITILPLHSIYKLLQLHLSGAVDKMAYCRPKTCLRTH